MAETVATPLELRRPRAVNRMFYRIMVFLLRPIILRYFRLEARGAECVPDSGAAIVLANHVTLFDPIWVYAMLRRPVYFAASEDLFRQPALAKLIRWFGAFPKRKAASDLSALRGIFSVAESGGIIGVFPEGVRTWDGRNLPIHSGIAKLIRKLKVPVYACRLEGAYLAYPRWARFWRRIPVKGIFSQLFEPGSIPDDDEIIVARISSALHTPDYDLKIDHSHYRQKGLAVNLTRLLYRCPSCGTQEGLKLVRPFKSNRVECSSCFSSWIIDVTCRLAEVDENGEPEGPWAPLPDIYEQIRTMPLTRIPGGVRISLEPDEQLYLISRPRFLFKQEQFPNLRVFAFGRAYLTSRRLLFRTRLGVPLSAPLEKIGALSVDPGDKMHFTLEGKLFRIPFRNESALKWYDTIQRIRDAHKAEPHR